MAMTEKKISIIVPLYNNSETIRECLDSILNQTLKDIEVICIDDCSEDNSVEIINEYKEIHPNTIRLIKHKRNSSASQSRKDGVLSSTGKYIMFVDADDFIDPATCEIAYNGICEKKTDIVHFGTVIENCGNLPTSRIQMNERLVAPYTKNVVNGNLAEECFLNGLFTATLWNKIYKGDLCREAFSEVVDGYFPKANDFYASFLILMRARSYAGVETQLYHYRFGLGMTGKLTMDLANFKTQCQGALVLNEIRKRIEREDEADVALYSQICDKIQENFLTEQCGKWYTNLPAALKQQGFQEMSSVWNKGHHFILNHLAKKHWYRRAEFASIFEGFDELDFKPRKVKTIVLYYHRIAGGGAQKVVAETCNMFAEAKVGSDFKYNVILVTDEPPSENDFPLSPRVSREVIQKAESFPKENDYSCRADTWNSIIDKYNVDLVIHSAWLSSVNTWDMLSIKFHPRKPAFVNHTHSVFPIAYRMDNKANELLKSGRIADGIVALSKMDTAIWQAFNKNSYMIVNPSRRFSDRNAEYSTSRKRILWLARLSEEKNPLDIIRIMEDVVKVHPDATCNIVGGGNGDLLKKMKDEIESKNLEHNVNLLNHVDDVGIFFSTASVFVSTSSFEGFGLTLVESASFGLPTVVYDLPWLEYFQAFDGWEQVPRYDTKEAAKRICHLLGDEAAWSASSSALKASYEKYEKIDILSIWETLLSDLENGTYPEPEHNIDIKTLVELITDFHDTGMKRGANERSGANMKLQQAYKEKSEINAKLQQTYKEKSEINAKLQQTYKEKSEINAKLQKTYQEKSKAIADLNQLHKEKMEQGVM
ncbi:glycosyltransferase, partial [Flagellimonas sp.]|uniref:glycosyltransferase n=1 Tax=Flagellimonas sp. TaxID=2058762 RepID=UPI003AB4657B